MAFSKERAILLLADIGIACSVVTGYAAWQESSKIGDQIHSHPDRIAADSLRTQTLKLHRAVSMLDLPSVLAPSETRKKDRPYLLVLIDTFKPFDDFFASEKGEAVPAQATQVRILDPMEAGEIIREVSSNIKEADIRKKLDEISRRLPTPSQSELVEGNLYEYAKQANPLKETLRTISQKAAQDLSRIKPLNNNLLYYQSLWFGSVVTQAAGTTLAAISIRRLFKKPCVNTNPPQGCPFA